MDVRAVVVWLPPETEDEELYFADCVEEDSVRRCLVRWDMSWSCMVEEVSLALRLRLESLFDDGVEAAFVGGCLAGAVVLEDETPAGIGLVTFRGLSPSSLASSRGRFFEPICGCEA